MIQMIRSAGIHHPLRSFAKCPPSLVGFRAFLAVRFRQVTSTTAERNSSHNMDKSPNPKDNKGDVMSHSFGEGYATRSDEEGFGGVYTDQNQSTPKTEGDRIIQDVNHPAYDKTQGSEVKEKEKARHQTNTSA